MPPPYTRANWNAIPGIHHRHDALSTAWAYREFGTNQRWSDRTFKSWFIGREFSWSSRLLGQDRPFMAYELRGPLR